MTVDTTYTPATYTGDNSTDEFALNHLVYESSHVSVKLDGVSTSAWSATGYGNAAGITVTMDSPPATGVTVLIERIVPYTQDTDLENFDGNPADVTEKQLDLLAMADQQIAEELGRGITVPIGTSLTSNEISGTIDTTTRILTITSSGPAASTLSTLSSSLDVVLSGEADGDFLKYDGSNWINRTAAEVRADLDLEIGTDVQAYDADLTAIGALAKTDGNFIVGNGSTWVVESGATARASLDVYSTTEVDDKVDGKLVLGTEITTTSVTAIDITGWTTGAKKIEVELSGVSTNGTDNWLLQIGTGGTPATSGYNGTGSAIFGTNNTVTGIYTAGAGIISGLAANNLHGIVTFTLEDVSNNTWVIDGQFGASNAAYTFFTNSSVSLAGIANIIRLTTTGGTNQFDSMALNYKIYY